MARIFKKKVPQDESNIDLTPMLDVVFIMLIFFIVTASFVQEVGFNVERPPPAPPNLQPTEKKNAIFQITETNEIMLENLRVDPRSVRARIERILAENPEATVAVRAHPNSEAQIYAGIADSAFEVSNQLTVSLIIVK